jgi:mono/diheme cytochrome c family protein
VKESPVRRLPVAAATLAAALALCAGPAARAAGADDASPERGHQVFETRCIVCHGANADGQGQLARMLDPKPANLRASRLDDAARQAIIRHGGAAVGRSPVMPRWELELDEQQLRDVIAYVASVAPARAGGRP